LKVDGALRYLVAWSYRTPLPPPPPVVTPPSSSASGDLPPDAPPTWARLVRGPVGWVGGLAICLVAAYLGQRSLRSVVADLDSFYHIGHAAVYASGALWDTALPWARHSLIGEVGGDLWWGYHLILAPFSALGVVPGIAAAGVACTGLLLAVLFTTLRLRGAAALPWTLFAFLAVPNVLYRLLMTRPHVLSLAAGLGVGALLAARRWRAAAAVSAALCWIHASFFWLPLLVLGGWLAARFLEADRDDLATDGRAATVATLGGVAAGLLLRPRPLATLRLLDVQLLDVLGPRGPEAALRAGGDLAPLPPEALVPTSWLFLGVWAVLVGGLLVARGLRTPGWRELDPYRRILGTTFALLSAGFLILALAVTSRAVVQWVVFGTAATALLAPALIPRPGLRRMAGAALVAVTLGALPWMGSWHATNVRLNAVPEDRLQEAARWLAEASGPGELVVHAHWDSFGPLFAWNRVNHYLGGMDPAFQYAVDPQRYPRLAGLAGPPPLAEDPGGVLSSYDPRWVLVEPTRDPALLEALRRDPRWDLARITEDAVVFQSADVEPGRDPPR